MNITIIRTKCGIGADGPLLLSALLKRAGHSVTTVFMPRGKGEDEYGGEEIECLHDLLQHSDLVMI